MQKKLGRNKQRFPIIKTSRSYDEILENKDIKCVFICTPPETHFLLAKSAMEKNKNVLVEKPLTRSIDEAKSLIEIAKNKSLKLMVGIPLSSALL